MRGYQWLKRDFETAKSDVEVRLLPWREIEVMVSGAVQEFPAASVQVWIVGHGISPGAVGGLQLSELLAMPDGTRRYRGEVGGPSSLQLSLRSMLVQRVSQDVEIADTAGIQRFTLTSTR
jgi:hypothetical protein